MSVPPEGPEGRLWGAGWAGSREHGACWAAVGEVRTWLVLNTTHKPLPGPGPPPAPAITPAQPQPCLCLGLRLIMKLGVAALTLG